MIHHREHWTSNEMWNMHLLNDVTRMEESSSGNCKEEVLLHVIIAEWESHFVQHLYHVEIQPLLND